MALETATNPTTGERFALINNEWKPFSETATNPTTKEKFGLIDNAWHSLGISAEAPVPQEDTPVGAGFRTAIEKAPAALGSYAGFGTGVAAFQGLAGTAGAAVGAAFPPAAPITVPITYGTVSLIGGLLGATAAGTAVDTASDYLFSQADPDGWKLRQEEKKRNPRATMLGDVASGLLGMSPATITRGLLKSTGERAVSGTLQGGLSAGMDVLGGEAPDWQKAGAQTVAGFVMPSFNRLGQSAFNLGQGASRAVLPNSWTKFTPEVAPKAPIVDESGTIKPATTADEESAFIRKLNESIEAKKAAAETGSSGEPPPPPRIESTVDVTSNTAVDEVSRVQKQIDSIDNPVLKKMAIEGSVVDPKMAEITTVSALGEHIKTTLGPDHLASRVLDALLPTLPKDSPSRVLKADEYEALYKSVGGTGKTTAFWHDDVGIVMRDGFGNNAITGAHEIAHAVLHSKIEAIKSLPVNHPDYIKLTKLVTDVTNLMNSVRSKVEVTPENKALFDYSLNDPHEFISNGIFEPRVANAILKIEQKQPGFVSKLVSYIGKFLGLDPKQYTALHELIRLTQRLAKAEVSGSPGTSFRPKGSTYNLETKRKDIFNKDSDTAKAWKAIGMFDLAQPVNERFSTASRDEATREIYKKYLTKKDVLDAARIQGNIKSNPTTKEGSVGLQHINNLLDKRSDGKWLEEITNLKKIKPSEMERAGEFYGEMQDNRTAGEKAKDTMSYNNEKVNFLKKDSKELEDMAHNRASNSAHSDQAEAYQEAKYEGKTLSDTELQKIFDNSYKYEYAKELIKLKNLQNTQGTNFGPKGSKLSQDIQDSVLGEQSKNEENIAVAHTSPIRIRNETPHGGDTGWRGNVGRGEDAAVFGVGTNVSTGTNVNNKYREQFQPYEELVLTTTSADGTPTTTTKTLKRYSPEKELWDEINYMEVRSVYGVPFFENIFSKYARKKGIERITRHYKEELNDNNGAFPDNPFVTGHRKLVAAEKLDLLKKYDWINAKTVDPAIGKFMGEEAPTFHMTLKAKPEEIMDWNAPISEQNPKVQAKVQKLIDRFFPALPENLSWTEAKDEKFRIPISAWTAQIGETKYVIKEKTDLVTPTNERYYQLLQYSKVGDGWSADTTIGEFSTLEQAKIGKPDPTGEAIYYALQKNFNKIEFDLEYKRARYRTSTNLKQKDALGKELDVEEKLLHLDYYVPEEYKSAALATEQLQSLGLVAHVFNSNAGQGTQFRNYIVYDDARLITNAIAFVKGSLLEESPAIVKASKDIDVRSLVENEFIKHAEQIYANEGEGAALAFFRDWKQHSTDKRISLPNTEKGLADTFFKLRTWAMADRMRYRVDYDATTYGREISMKERFFPSEEMAIQKEQMDGIREIAFREREGQNDPQFLAQRAEVEANPELKAKYDFLTERLKAGDTEVTALIQRIRTLTGDDRVVAGLETGQARYIMKSKRERTLEELLGGGKDNPLIESNKEASSIKGRSLFQLEDGRVIQVEKVGDVEMVLEWKLNKDGTPFPSVWADKDGSYHAVPGYIAKGKPGEALTAGSTIRVAGKDMVIKDGQVHNIERLTPYRYFKDAEATQYKKIMELEKMARELELIDKMKENKFFNLAAGPDAEKIPAGWKQITDVDTLPQLRGWSFDPKVAWIIEDFAKTWDKGWYLRSTDFLIKNMMLVPIPHIFNEAAHLWALRGLSGWVTPKGLTRFGSTLGLAFKDVAEQGRFYQEVAKEGGSLLGADPRNNEVFNAMGRDYVERAVKIPAVKAALAKVGYSVADFYNAWSQNSQKSMWFTRDLMYMQALREIIKLNETRGTPVTTKQAIDLVQDHMPAYRLPTVIMNSRLLSKALQNPYLAVFSRYHYGVTKSIANIGKELNPQNLKTAEGKQEFKDGIDRMLATVVAMTIGYAAVDAALEVVFGPGTTMRRAGPFHLYHAIEEAVVGNKDASAFLFAVFTFNPVTSTLGQLVTNRQLYKNKYPEIYHPNDPIEDKASDVASYLGRSIPQAGGILRASDQDNYAGFLAKQFDVKIKTPEQIRASEKSKKREDTEAKYRSIKREQGVYRP